jgi:hypothetical protein
MRTFVTRWGRAVVLASVTLGAVVVACSGGSQAPSGDGGSPIDATQVTDGEPEICTEFTEAGAPCSRVSPVRCFAECTTGGCSCQTTPAGPRWTCVTDLSCVPDCAPVDEACSPQQGGDDGSATDDGGEAGPTGDGGDATVGDGGDGGEGGDAGDAGEGGSSAGDGGDAAPGGDAGAG